MALDKKLKSNPVQDFMERVDKRMRKKGFKPVQNSAVDNTAPAVSVKQRISRAKPQEKPAFKQKSLVERVVERQGGSPRDICHTVYNALHESGLVISPERTLKTGKVEYVDLSGNNAMQMCVSEKSYSAPLLFTHLVALTGQGSMMFTGQAGTGKTSSAVLVSSFLFGKPLDEVRKAVIQGNPELTFGDMIAVTNIADLVNKGIERVHPRSFVTSTIRIIDEVNRITPGKRAILYSIADNGQVQFRDKIIKAPPGPLYATANPKDSGNDTLEPPFLDRYDVCVKARALVPHYIELLTSRGVQDKMRYGIDLLRSIPHLSDADFIQIRKEIDDVDFDKDALSRLAYFLAELNFCDRGGRDVARKTKSDADTQRPGPLCNNCHYLTDLHICNQAVEGLSPRGYKAAYLYPKIFAWWQGKKKAGQEEVELILPYVVRHRVEPTSHAVNKDSIYRNDRHAFVCDLIETSGKAYEQDVAKFPQLAELTSLVYRVNKYGKKSGVKRGDIMMLMREYTKKIDSGARASIAVALNDVAERLK